MLANPLRLLAARRAPAPGATEPADAADPDAAFRCADAREVQALLAELRDGAVPINLGAPGGTATTAVIGELDAARRRLTLDVEPGDPLVERLVGADEASAVAYLASIRVQFDVAGMVLVRGPRRSALQCTWPTSVWRFQRRRAFRLAPAADGSPSATLHLPGGQRVTLRLLDVSADGCALLLPADGPAIAPGSELRGVVLEIDESLAFCTPLTVQHVSSLPTMPGGLRLGCAFGRLTPQEARALQRHIDQTQRRRRVRSLE